MRITARDTSCDLESKLYYQQVENFDFLQIDPLDNAKRYLTGRTDQLDRYASWDHCFNYFRKAYDEQRLMSVTSEKELQNSCLQLGFYLASWGMYRGKAPLLRRSASALAPLISEIASAPSDLWECDIEHYNNDSIKLLLEWAGKIRSSLPGRATDTLVTKVMLGVFGNVPAFDRYYRAGIDSFGLNSASLMKIKTYFDHHHDAITSMQIPTIDFAGNETTQRYTQAKVVDMVFFVAGGGMGPQSAPLNREVIYRGRPSQ